MEELLQPDGEARETQTRNEMSVSSAEGPVVQTGPVHGNQYINWPRETRVTRVPPPNQLLPVTAYFTNHSEPLAHLTRLTGAGTGAGAGVGTGAGASASAGSGSGADAPLAPPVAVVTGIGGIGKTTLAMRWARDVAGEFTDGALFCDLRGSSEETPAAPGTVLDSFLRALGVPGERIPDALDARAALFREASAGRRLLVVLDNAVSAAQVHPLIPGGSGPVTVVTSRIWLSGLAVRHDAQHIRLGVLRESDSVMLLRGILMASGRQDDDEEELAELARLCANLPLALRMAAAHAVSRQLVLAELLEDMRDNQERWAALTTDEGQAVRGIFSLAYRHLAPEPARMFRVLGLHDGPDISLGVAAAAAGMSRTAARRALNDLTQANLLESLPQSQSQSQAHSQSQTQTQTQNRYRRHNLLLAYARELANETDEESERRETVSRIVRWYAVTARNASEVLLPGRAFELGQSVAAGIEPGTFETGDAARQWFDAGRPSLVPSARSAMDNGLFRQVWELAMALSPLHASYFTFDDWSVLSELALTAAGHLSDPAAVAAALDNRGRYLYRRGELREARDAHVRALAIQEETREVPGALRSLNGLGLVCLRDGDLPAAIEFLTLAMTRARRAGEPRWLGAASLNLAHVLLESARVAEALEILAPLPEFFAGRRDQLNVGTSHHLIARAYRLRSAGGPDGDHAGDQAEDQGGGRDGRGDAEAALAEINVALQIAADEKKPVWEADWLVEAARVHLALGDGDGAIHRSRRAVEMQRELGDAGREAEALVCLAEVLEQTGAPQEAARARSDAARIRGQNQGTIQG